MMEEKNQMIHQKITIHEREKSKNSCNKADDDDDDDRIPLIMASVHYCILSQNF